MCIHIFLFHHLNEWESEWMKINLELSNFMETIFFFLNGQAMLLHLLDISESFLFENNSLSLVYNFYRLFGEKFPWLMQRRDFWDMR